MSINYQLTYNQGYEAGQRFYARTPDYRPAELRRIAEQESARQDLPMVLHVHYRDGFIDGYRPAKQEGNTAQ